MPDDYSKLVPHLPIPNRTVKRLCADDSAATSVKVGHRQALILKSPSFFRTWGFLLWGLNLNCLRILDFQIYFDANPNADGIGETVMLIPRFSDLG